MTLRNKLLASALSFSLATTPLIFGAEVKESAPQKNENLEQKCLTINSGLTSNTNYSFLLSEEGDHPVTIRRLSNDLNSLIILNTSEEEYWEYSSKEYRGTDYTKFVVPIDIQLVRLNNLQEEYTNEQKARDLLELVTSIKYVPEEINYPRYPQQTLFDGGDCEDHAILYASLLRELGIGCALLIYPELKDEQGNPILNDEGESKYKAHMLTGVAGNFEGDYIDYNRVRYFITETTTYRDIGNLNEERKSQTPSRVIPIPASHDNEN